MHMKHVKFLPWIGKNYMGGFNGMRTLVLGESHYAWKQEPDLSDKPNVTSECIQEQLDGDYTKAFWTKLAKAMSGEDTLTLEGKAKFWHSVAFYNYVQESAGLVRGVNLPTKAGLVANCRSRRCWMSCSLSSSWRWVIDYGKGFQTLTAASGP